MLFSPTLIKQLGISDWGYTEEDRPISWKSYEAWVQKESHGPLSYLSDHRFQLRSNLKNFYPDFKSALVFLFDYTPQKKVLNSSRVASYALAFEGEDYHHVLRTRLETLGESLLESYPKVQWQLSLDIHPVLERDLAFRAGLGWFGKNSMLIHPSKGSFFLIGSLLLNSTLEIQKREKVKDHCGDCTACVDACPTLAIDPESRTLEALKCISTYTIETFKESRPPQGLDQSRQEIFGCDICQDVCPWNHKPLKYVEEKKLSSDKFSHLSRILLEGSFKEVFLRIKKMSKKEFKQAFQGTVFFRTGKKGLLKNLKAVEPSLEN